MEELDLELFDDVNDVGVIDETTNGQEQMKFLLNDLDRRSSEFILQIPLAGDLDFAILEQKGFSCIRKIVFQKPGKITGFIALPKTLIVLDCPNQKITHLGTLPPTLEELTANGNQISGLLDLETCPRLIRLNVADNKITGFVHLPASLEDFICNNNDIETLNLSAVPTLKTLNVSDNRYAALTIISLPPHLFKFKNDNTNLFYSAEPATEQRNPERQQRKKRVNYDKALYDYFKQKALYESQNH
ncbi:MAG: hypothetical protein NTV32_09865, partial [Gammaproteobacteria bacterium]|nr:hypothetical protein [Gammaproteobacteria bacterium]